MHTPDLSPWQHSHVFDEGNAAAERGTRLVMWITIVTMVAEIAAGLSFNSMALLADGLHMSGHAVAIGLSAFAYAAARRNAKDPQFARSLPSGVQAARRQSRTCTSGASAGRPTPAR